MVAGELEVLTELEVRGGPGAGVRALDRAGDDLVRRVHVGTVRAVRHPVAHHLHVPLRLGPDLLCLDQDPGDVVGQGGGIERAEGIRLGVATGVRRLRGPHDGPRLVDPDAVRHVHHPEQLVDDVPAVDERRVRRSRAVRCTASLPPRRRRARR